MNWILFVAHVFVLEVGTLSAVPTQSEPDTIDRASLEIAVDLASDVSETDREVRGRILEFLSYHIEVTDRELTLAHMIPRVSPDDEFRALTVSADTTPAAHLNAVLTSRARFLGAQRAASQEWTHRQREALVRFASLAAISLEDAARLDDKRVENLRSNDFAVRRDADAAADFRERLRTQGLVPEHRELLLWSGWSDGDIESYRQALIATDPDEIGLSMVELVESIATTRRELAGRLRTIIPSAEAPLPDFTSGSFLLANPHDRDETINLFIRPASLPPDWKVTIVGVDSLVGGKIVEVIEDKPGREYRVSLPQRASVRLGTVLVPSGEIAEGVSARWAVEGWIGSELLGGIVQEMQVPGNETAEGAAPLPTTAMVLPAAQEQPGGWDWRWAAFSGGGLLLVMLWLLMRRRRGVAEM